MKKIKLYYTLRVLITTIFGIAIGAALYLLSPYATEIFDILVIAMGLLTAVMNLPALLLALRYIKRRGEWINLLLSICSILLGMALMLLQTDFLLLLLGIYSIALPLLRILLVEEHFTRFKREVPRFLTGLVMVIIFLTESEGYILQFGALVAIALSLVYLLHGLILMRFLFRERKPRPSHALRDEADT